MSSTSRLRQLLRVKAGAFGRAPQVVYINEFPYSKKKEMEDYLPEWRTDQEKYPTFNIPWLRLEEAYVIQDKKTNIIYNWFTHNYYADDYVPTEKDVNFLREVVMRKFKSAEDKLDFRILGREYAFCRKHWRGSEHFIKLGDQFVQFFDCDDIYYYHDRPVYEDWIDDSDVEDMEDDYQEKHVELRKDFNYTNENLGVKR